MFQIGPFKFRLASASLLCGCLSACGGGGDGSNESEIGPEPETGSIPAEDPADFGNGNGNGSEPTSASEPMPSGSADGQQIDQIGVILVQHNDLPASMSTSATANFYRLETPVPGDFPLTVFPQEDRCGFGLAEGIALPGIEALGVNPSQAVSLSAGEVVTISSQNGSYASLVPEPVVTDEDIDYKSGEIGVAPFRLDLRISIPGNEFPAIPEVSLPLQQRFDSTVTEQLRNASSNPTLRWTVNPLADDSVGLVSLTAGSSDADAASPRVFSCIAIDDGEFTLPAEVLDAIGNNFTPLFVSVFHLRVTRRVVDEAGFVILQMHLQ